MVEKIEKDSYAPPITVSSEAIEITRRRLQVTLPTSAQITLALTMERYVNPPIYGLPG
jgi:hypothetical protein